MEKRSFYIQSKTVISLHYCKSGNTVVYVTVTAKYNLGLVTPAPRMPASKSLTVARPIIPLTQKDTKYHDQNSY